MEPRAVQDTGLTIGSAARTQSSATHSNPGNSCSSLLAAARPALRTVTCKQGGCLQRKLDSASQRRLRHAHRARHFAWYLGGCF